MLAVQCPLVAAMAATAQTVLRQRFCKASQCRVLFFICTHCDRGQRYCSTACRRSSRLDQQRAAGRRHQRSLEGRLDHRDRQRAYRLRRAAVARVLKTKSVTQHGSNAEVTSATMEPPRKEYRQPIRSRWLQLIRQAVSGLGLVICHFCGRVGRFLNPFHESG